MIQLSAQADLAPKHISAMSLKLSGKTHKEIAKEISTAKSTVDHWFIQGGLLYESWLEYKHKAYNPDKQFLPAEHTITHAESVGQQIKRLSKVAIDSQENLLLSDIKPSDKIALSNSLLDRAGYKPVERVAVANLDGLNKAQLDELILSIINKHKNVNSIDSSVQSNNTPTLIDDTNT